MELPLVNQQIFTRCAYMRVSEVGQTKQTDFCIIHCRFFFDGSSSPHLTAFLFIRRFSFKNQFPLFRNQNKQSIRARHRRSISRIRSPSLSGAFLPLYTLDLRSLKRTGLERAISQSVRELTLQQSVSFFLQEPSALHNVHHRVALSLSEIATISYGDISDAL